jgi:hypothetical protein
MSLPILNAGEVQGIVQQVAEYIGAQRSAYRPAAEPLSPTQRAKVSPFFPQSALDLTRLLAGQFANPPFYAELVNMGFQPSLLPNFANMAAITYVDTVVSRVPFADRLLFHELVHVVQYQKLGLASFAAKYVMGFLTGGSYETIPLERNAYELEDRFVAAPTQSFSVANEVQAWIDAGRF